MKRTFCVTVAALAVAVAPAAAAAQTPVHWSAHIAARSVRAGAVVPVTVTATIAPGWHVYSLTQPRGGPFALRLTVPDGQPFALAGSVKAPVPKVGFDKNFGIQVETYVNSANFWVPIKVEPSTKAGVQTATIAARFQVCNASLCMPPQTVKLAIPVDIK